MLYVKYYITMNVWNSLLRWFILVYYLIETYVKYNNEYLELCLYWGHCIWYMVFGKCFITFVFVYICYFFLLYIIYHLTFRCSKNTQITGCWSFLRTLTSLETICSSSLVRLWQMSGSVCRLFISFECCSSTLISDLLGFLNRSKNKKTSLGLNFTLHFLRKVHVLDFFGRSIGNLLSPVDICLDPSEICLDLFEIVRDLLWWSVFEILSDLFEDLFLRSFKEQELTKNP